jgi:hypothetical protein
MPANIFKYELDKALDSKYHTGVYKSGKAVASRLLKQYVRPKADAEAQTESIKELTSSYEVKIERLEHNIETM